MLSIPDEVAGVQGKNVIAVMKTLFSIRTLLTYTATCKLRAYRMSI